MTLARSPLKRRARKLPPPIPPEVRAEALARSGGRCIVCGQPWRIQLHHVLPKGKWPEHRADAANLVALCEQCHARHESAFRRVPLRLLPDCAQQLAEAHGLSWYLERTYP